MNKLSKDDIVFMCVVAIVFDCLVTFLILAISSEFGFEFNFVKFWAAISVFSMLVVQWVIFYKGYET
ncbi:MAG: hypothetical protein J6M43_04400 [Neisseriaceae bacterium]|nr:hypothetical protein [Neisseriaceae bacterium]